MDIDGVIWGGGTQISFYSVFKLQAMHGRVQECTYQLKASKTAAATLNNRPAIGLYSLSPVYSNFTNKA